MAKYPAAFINAISEEGTKADAILWLQQTWDKLCEAKATITIQQNTIQILHTQLGNLSADDPV